MKANEQTNVKLHKKLPIDDDENIIAVYRHHWFAYAVNWIVAGFLVIVIMAVAIGLTSFGGNDSSFSAHQGQIIAGAAVFCVFILLGTLVPVYLRSQEQLVLTDESLLQVLQPSLFASKVDSVSLGRIDDVSVRQTFLGTIFGFGHMTVETPGEQDNYEFYILPSPHDAAREITNNKENFEAALNAGRLPTTMGQAPVQAPQLDPQQYQQFLQYQQMLAQQQADNGQTPAAPQNQPLPQQSQPEALQEPVQPVAQQVPQSPQAQAQSEQPTEGPAQPQSPAYPPSADTTQNQPPTDPR